MTDRIPCINPRCRRTCKPDLTSSEMICAKCFRCLPTEVRAEHRGFWRKIRLWERRIARTADEIKIARMRNIVRRLTWRLNVHWTSEIRARMLDPEKPRALEAFLEEIGL